ncbi:MAG: 3-hydroxyisobutyrate dehydrogenase [Bradyrhizobium sp.]|nr:3-hydroxyisobutyrate dehydrogenase [Bradyrhizobium sp.]
MHIGFIGLGRMGGGMARRMLAHGRSVIGFDTNEETMAAFAGAGGRVAASIREVADQAEIVFASLPTIAVSRDVALGAGGIVGGAAVKIYVETSTIGPGEARRLAQEMGAASDIIFVDAPVSGGPKGAEDGSLTTVVAGPKSAFDAVAPYWRDMAAHIVHAGEAPGLGQLYKVINNYIVMNSLAATCEAIAVGVRAGADEASLVDLINHATGRNFATNVYFPSVILPRAKVPSLRMAAKDVRLFAELADEVGHSSSGARGILVDWEAAADDNLNMVDWYEGMLARD